MSLERLSSKIHLEELKKEAAAGDAHAIFELAKHYRWGWLVEFNPALAMQYFISAANKNHVGANIELGKMHLRGDRELNVSIDINKAKTYFKKATEGILHDAPNYNPRNASKEAALYLKAVDAIHRKTQATTTA